MKGLKDIKPIVDVPDNSLYIFIVIIALLFLLAGLFWWWMKKPKRIRRRKPTLQELAKQRLNAIDYGDTKESVYTFSDSSRVLVADEKREELENLISKLEDYKYKKDVPKLQQEDKEAMQKMVKEISNV